MLELKTTAELDLLFVQSLCPGIGRERTAKVATDVGPRCHIEASQFRLHKLFPSMRSSVALQIA